MKRILFALVFLLSPMVHAESVTALIAWGAISEYQNGSSILPGETVSYNISYGIQGETPQSVSVTETSFNAAMDLDPGDVFAVSIAAVDPQGVEGMTTVAVAEYQGRLGAPSGITIIFQIVLTP